MTRERLIVLAPVLVVLAVGSFALFAERSVTESAGRPSSLSTFPGGPAKHPKLASQLVALSDAAAAGFAPSAETLPPEVAGAVATDRMRLRPGGEVQVYIVVDDAAEPDTLRSLGAEVERVDAGAGIVQTWLPATSLRAAAALTGVRAIRLPDYPVAQAGSIQTEGDAVLQSDDLRDALGVDGTGVTVGVISDGVGGLAAAQASGDLPVVDTATCNVAGGDPGAAGAEGTAMLEIVHDIAPGAELLFGNFGFGTALDFNAAVDCLAANADIVVDDIGWFGVGPYDGTSLVSQNTADALNGTGPIRGYFTAVGNQALDHYQEPYVASSTELTGLDIFPAFVLPPDDTWVFHQFDATGGPEGTEHAGAVPAPADGNRVVLPAGEIMTVVLVWDDPWGSAPNDYDLFIRESGDVWICSGEFQGGTAGSHSLPVEVCGWVNPGPADAEFDIMIGNYLGAAGPVTFDMFLLCTFCYDLGNGSALDFHTEASSVPNQSDAGGSPAAVVSLGAVDHFTPNDIEPFSSRGLTEDARTKPDIVAPDGVCISGAGGFGQGSCQGSGRAFFGTSAAAPHAAGVAALLLECEPGLDRNQLRERMLNSAVDLGPPGPDSVYGYGRLNAPAAAECAGAATATPTPTATDTPATTPSPTVTATGEVPATPPASLPPAATATPSATPTAAATSTPTFTPSPTATDTPTATPTPILAGDANCDGTVNAVDAAFILQFGAQLLGSLPCPAGADANQSGSVDAIDGALVLQLVAGLLQGLPR